MGADVRPNVGRQWRAQRVHCTPGLGNGCGLAPLWCDRDGTAREVRERSWGIRRKANGQRWERPTEVIAETRVAVEAVVKKRHSVPLGGARFAADGTDIRAPH